MPCKKLAVDLGTSGWLDKHVRTDYSYVHNASWQHLKIKKAVPQNAEAC